jgi:hypothetical protein
MTETILEKIEGRVRMEQKATICVDTLIIA